MTDILEKIIPFLVLGIIIVFIVGLIKPALIIRWSNKPTRWKVMGWCLLTFVLLLSISLILESFYTSEKRINKAKHAITKGDHSTARRFLEKIEQKDVYYAEAQMFLAQADSIKSVEETKKKAEADMKKTEAEAKKKANAEAKAAEAETKKAEAEIKKAEAEKRKSEAEKRKSEAAKQKADDDAKRKADDDAKRKAETEAKKAEQASTSSTSQTTSTSDRISKPSGTQWSLKYISDGTSAGTLFLNPDGSAQLTGNSSGGSGRWSEESGYMQGNKFEWIQYKQGSGLIIYVRKKDGYMTDDWTMVITGANFWERSLPGGFKLQATRLN